MTDLIDNGESGSSVRASLNALSSNAVQFMTVSVSLGPTQILALTSSPTTIVPAPGPRKAILIAGVVTQFKAGSLIYDAPSGSQIGVSYASGPITSTLGTANFGLNSDQEAFWSYIVNAHQSAPLSLPTADIENIAVIVSGADQVAGPILTSTKGAGGLGYAPGDTGGLPNVDSGDATYVIDTVGAGGAVLTYHLDNHGTGYIVQTGAATQVTTGGGDGNFTINIISVQTGNGTAKITVTYQILQLPPQL